MHDITIFEIIMIFNYEFSFCSTSNIINVIIILHRMSRYNNNNNNTRLYV